MKVFRQVVESGSFVGAAERLSVSTAMTSKHVMHLEKYLGSRLLNRSSHSLSLTEPGRLFFERCKGILEEMQGAESAVGSVSGAPRGTLRISAPSWTATRSTVDLLAAYRRLYPEVVVDISFEDRFVDLIAEGYDLAIRATSDRLPAGLIARPLRPMPFVIAASPEYLRRCGVPKSPEDLARHDSVMVGNEQSWRMTGPNGKVEVPARPVLRFASMTVAVAHAACTGIGLAALPRVVFEDPMFKDALCPVLTKYSLRHPHLYAVYASRKHLQPKVRTFVDHAIQFVEALQRDETAQSRRAPFTDTLPGPEQAQGLHGAVNGKVRLTASPRSARP
jgi:DNA-binding transcriptional LysR family regulator